jgi:cytochrome c
MSAPATRRALRPAAIALALALTGTAWADVDADAAQALVKKSDCLKCHSVDKKKDGPSFKETAGKYKGKADGETKLFTHLTTHPKVKVDGKEEEHASLKTKNEPEIRNVIQWILSR